MDYNVTNLESMKILHEKFVTGHTGSDVLDIVIIASSAPVACLCRNSLLSFFHQLFIFKGFVAKFLLDFSTLIGFVILYSTLLSNNAPLLLTFSIVISLLIQLYFLNKNVQEQQLYDETVPNIQNQNDTQTNAQYNTYNTAELPNNKQNKNKLKTIKIHENLPENYYSENRERKILTEKEFSSSYLKKNNNLSLSQERKPLEFISLFRAYVNIATAVFILAVDFNVFPRRFCKTETYGAGLMDIGVGSFVISNAIVSREARYNEPTNSISHSIFSSWPLIILGVSRILAIKGSGYHEHVSEYGVHWNFFFTLAIIKVLSSSIYKAFSPKYSLLSAIVISLLYEGLLVHFGLAKYLLKEEGRENMGFFEANREGLCSCAGYLVIYLAGVQLGKFLFSKKLIIADLLDFLKKLVLLTVLLWILLHYLQIYVAPISRRMANLSFIVWMLAYNVQMIASFLINDIVQLFFHHLKSSPKHQRFSDLNIQTSDENGNFERSKDSDRLKSDRNEFNRNYFKRTENYRENNKKCDDDYAFYYSDDKNIISNRKLSSLIDYSIDATTKNNFNSNIKLNDERNEQRYRKNTEQNEQVNRTNSERNKQDNRTNTEQNEQEKNINLNKPIVNYPIIEAVNQNGLFYFLMANLMTGSVNMSMDTINTSVYVSMVTIVVYMAILTIVSTLLFYKKIKIKFW